MEEKSYNLDYLYEISNGDKLFIQDMLNEFITNTPDVLNQLDTLLQKENWNEMYVIVHRFAPTFDFVGANKLKIAIEKLEKCTKYNLNLNEVPALLNEIKLQSNLIISEIKTDFNIK